MNLYHTLDQQIKQSIISSRRGNFVSDYNDADTLKEKWNIIHKSGVTRKSRKEVLISVEENYGLDNLNDKFKTRLKS